MYNPGDLSTFHNTSRDIKPSLGTSGYSDMSWLNIESGALLNSSNLHSGGGGYIPDLHTGGGGTGLGLLQPYEHFQLGLEDSAGLKSSNGSINTLPTTNDMFLDTNIHCGLYGGPGDSSTLLNLDLKS